jgi:ketosteroid isomerase-like protein
MSQESVEIVRRAFDAFNRRDIHAALQDVYPEIELDWSRSAGLEAGVYPGFEASRAFWSNFLQMFDPFIITPEEFIECGEHVVVPNHTRAWGRDGIKVEAHAVTVVTLHNGRIAVWRLYKDRSDALKAVGLEE